MKTYAQYNGRWITISQEEAESNGHSGSPCFAVLILDHKLGTATLIPGADLGDLTTEEKELFADTEVCDDRIDEHGPHDAADYAEKAMENQRMVSAFAFVSQFAAMRP